MIVLDLGPAPAPPLSLNRERTMHWAARNRRLDPWRDLATWLARCSNTAEVVAGRPATITVVLPVKGHYRRDPHNYVPTVKAIIDGLIVGGVWPDDTATYVTVNEPVLAVNGRNAEVRIVFRDEAAA